MIQTLDDYYYWWYLDDDMPTDRINGEIMPLRSAARKNDLRGVDIAFLAENMAECSAAASGWYWQWDSSVGYYRQTAAGFPSANFTLTRRLSGQQIKDRIWSPLDDNLGRDSLLFNPTVNTFWTGDSFSSTVLWSDRNERPTYAEINAMIDAQLPVHALHSQPSVASAAFDTGAPLNSDNVMALFTDARKLRYPVRYICSLFELFKPTADYRYADEGAYPYPAIPSVSWNYWSEWLDGAAVSRTEWCSNTRDIIDMWSFMLNRVKLFIVYDASRVDNPHGDRVEKFFGGVVMLEPFLAKTTRGQFWIYNGAGDLMWRRVLAAMLGDPPSATADNTAIQVSLLDASIFAIGEMDDRCKWW